MHKWNKWKAIDSKLNHQWLEILNLSHRLGIESIIIRFDSICFESNSNYLHTSSQSFQETNKIAEKLEKKKFNHCLAFS